MADILCTGLSFCDLLFTNLESLPQFGRESWCEDFRIQAGGAANTPLGLTRLGVETLFCSVLGDDDPGRLVHSILAGHGLDMRALVVDPTVRTSVSAVLSQKHDRGFASFLGGDPWPAMGRQLEAYAAGCTRLHSYVADCQKLPIVETARKHGLKLSIDGGWDGQLALEDLKSTLAACDVFFANEDEAGHLARTDNPESALAVIQGLTPGTVVVKLGSRGALVSSGPGAEVLRVPASYVDRVVDTTGAGDLFAAGFLAGRMAGWSDWDSGLLASASGALSVTYAGGMDVAYTKDAVFARYEVLRRGGYGRG